MPRRRDELDGLEPVRPNFQQLIAAKALLAVQVRRHSELPFCHRPNCDVTTLKVAEGTCYGPPLGSSFVPQQSAFPGLRALRHIVVRAYTCSQEDRR